MIHIHQIKKILPIQISLITTNYYMIRGFLKTRKEIWKTLKKVYINEKNISRVFKLYEHMFTLKQTYLCPNIILVS